MSMLLEFLKFYIFRFYVTTQMTIFILGFFQIVDELFNTSWKSKKLQSHCSVFGIKYDNFKHRMDVLVNSFV